MPRLYCEEHGREREAGVIARQEEYRREGESVLIVRGRLRGGPWHCDRCNAALTRGAPAYLASAFPGWLAEQTEDYDFAYEREYFSMQEATVAVYGAAWPAIAPTPAGRVLLRAGGQAKRRRPQEPLCALDLFAEEPETAD